MMQTRPTQPETLGADLRAIRKARGKTLAEVAVTLGRSVGWLSQVERDLSVLSGGDLRRIAGALAVPVSILSGRADAPTHETGYVVRRGRGRRIGPDVAGLTEELLSPDLTDDFEVVHSTFDPGAKTADPVCRPTQEVAYLISGRLDLVIGGKTFTINSGDSFRIRAEPYEWANPYPDPAVAIWVIAPPVY